MDIAPELINEILSHLSPSVPYQDYDLDKTALTLEESLDDPNVHALLACSLVNKMFYAFVRRKLYSRVTVYMQCPKTFHRPYLTSFSGFYHAIFNQET